MLRKIVSENRRTLSLAVPMVTGHVGQMLMGVIDTIMVGRVGVVPLAACAFANTLLSIPMVFGFGVLSAVSVRAAHAHGAGRPEEAKVVVRAGMVTALAMGAPVAVLLHFALPWLGVLGQPPEINQSVGGYLLLCGWSIVPVFLTTVSKNYCEAFSRPWAPFRILVLGVLLNAFLNWLFIFGNWGAPALGLTGAGLATLLARILTMLAVIAYPWFDARLRAGWPGHALFAAGPESVRQLLRLGLPAGGLHLCEVSGFSMGSIMMGWIGVTALAAHQIAITCAATTFLFPLGLAQAISVRVGHARGAAQFDRLRPIIFGGGLLTLGVMAVFMLMFVFGGRVIAGWFVGDQDVVELTARLLMLAAVFQIFDGIQVVSAGVLRGYEDTRVPMVIGIISYWLVALPVCYLMAFVFGWGAPGVWMGFVVGLSVAAIALGARVAKKLSTGWPSAERGR